MRVNIPKQCIILLSGIPSIGKSTFGSYLSREHGFAHYDLECWPCGWPQSQLKPIWDVSCQRFVKEVCLFHKRIALDWGFPVHCLHIVQALQVEGVQLVWFAGDVVRARESFVRRGGIALSAFDNQVEAIRNAGLPHPLKCVVVNALSANGEFIASDQVAEVVFGTSATAKADA